MATIYQKDGNSVYDVGGQTIYANGPNAGKVYSPPAATASAPVPPTAPSGAALNTAAGVGPQATVPAPAPVYSPPTYTPPAYTPPPPPPQQQQNLQTTLQASGATPTQASALATSAAPVPNADGTIPSSNPKLSQYSFKPMANGNVEVFENGKSIAPGGAGFNSTYAQSLGYTPVSSTGVPGNAGSVLGANTTMPDAKSPIDLASLSGGNLDLGKILGAGAGGTGVSNDIAGLLSMYGASTDSQKAYDKTNQDLIDAMKTLGGQGADYQAELDKQGVNDAYSHVKQLNLDAARLKGDIEAFDTETERLTKAVEGQAIPTGLIRSQQEKIRSDREILKGEKTAEFSRVIALGQAYQGNAELGEKLASRAIDIKYAPIENNIKVLQAQSAIASDKMNREDSKRSKIIETLLSFKLKQVDEAKTKEKDLEKIGIQAAAGGAPLSEVQAAIALGDAVQASAALSKYLKGPTESLAGTARDPNTILSVSDAKALGVPYGTTVGQAAALGKVPSGGPDDTSDTKLFTQTQENSGAANAGMSIDQFANLDANTKNWFVNSYDDFKKKLDGKSATQAQQILASDPQIPGAAKQILGLRLGVPSTGSSSAPLTDFTNGALNGAWTGVKSFLGI